MDAQKLELIRLAKASLRAVRLTGKTVVSVNDDMLIDAAAKLVRYPRIATIGIKDTAQISRSTIRQLVENGAYVWHTIDAMAEGGRAVDSSLLNPLTFRPMTGSSSATALNVLSGINDIGLGTDGGGSVLAPALSLNLAAIMAKGLGLSGNETRKSTDRISFTPGIGVISHSFELARDAVLTIIQAELPAVNYSNLRIAVCEAGQIVLPDGSDMNERLSGVVAQLRQWGCSVETAGFPSFCDRLSAIQAIEALFQDYDLLLTYEGPVDIWGIGDSVFGSMGDTAKAIQQQAGKYLIKIANMVNATAVAIPSSEVASGIVLAAREGREAGLQALGLAGELTRLFPPPELFMDYFMRGLLRRRSDLTFSLKE
jgi:hypothetical protein